MEFLNQLSYYKLLKDGPAPWCEPVPHCGRTGDVQAYRLDNMNSQKANFVSNRNN